MTAIKIIIDTKPRRVRKDTPQLGLIIYDTLQVNVGRSNKPADLISLPGKYALYWYPSGQDTDKTVSLLFRDEGLWEDVEWFNLLEELPAAILKFRGRQTDVVLPVYVSKVTG